LGGEAVLNAFDDDEEAPDDGIDIDIAGVNDDEGSQPQMDFDEDDEGPQYAPENPLESEFNIMTPSLKAPGVKRDLVLSKLNNKDIEELGHLQGALLQAKNIERTMGIRLPSLTRFVHDRYAFIVNGKRALGGTTLSALRVQTQDVTQRVFRAGGSRPKKKFMGIF